LNDLLRVVVKVSYRFVSLFVRLHQPIDLLQILILIKVIDLVINNLLFNTISPVIESARISKSFLLFLVDSPVIDLVIINVY